MGATKEGYITAIQASETTGKGINLIAKLCQSGRLPGAEKIADDLAGIREGLTDAKGE
jgi:hypothetical protein